MERIFSEKDLYKEWALQEPDLPERTARARIRRLVVQGTLEALGRGQYIKAHKRKEYHPDPSTALMSVVRNVQQEFSYVEAIYWESSWLNLFLNHQRVTNCIFIDTEAEVSSQVFDVLRSTSHDTIQGYETFLKPDRTTSETYIATSRDRIIIRNLRGQHLWHMQEGIKLARLEKILTDVWLDKHVLFFEEGEKKEIVYEAAKRYLVHVGKVKQYARNRAPRAHIDRLVKTILEAKGVRETKGVRENDT